MTPSHNEPTPTPMSIETFTQTPLETEGTYRAFPVAWTLEAKDSGAVAIAIRYAIHSVWDPAAKSWSQEWPAGYFTDGRTWVVKKAVVADPQKGIAAKPPEVAQGAVDQLAKAGLWNGDWDALAGPVPQVFVLIEVNSEEWNGRVRIRADWVSPDAAEPRPRGGFAPSDPGALALMRQRFQTTTRAIAGNTPAGPAAAPPSAAPVAAPVGTPAPAAAPVAAPAAAPTAAPAAAPVTAPQAAPVAAPGAPAAQPASQPVPAQVPTAAPTAAPMALPPTAPLIPSAAPVASPPLGAPPATAPPAAPPVGQGFVSPAAGTTDDPFDPGETPF